MRIDRVAERRTPRADAGRTPIADRRSELLHRGPPVEEFRFPADALRGAGLVRLEDCVDAPIPDADRSAALESILSELRLIHGIGGRFDRSLRGEGYVSIPALAGHPRWGDRARRLLAEWGSPPDPARIHRTLTAWLGATDPLFLRLLALLPPERLVFLDLETLGLGAAAVFLAAIARPTGDGRLAIRQYFAPTLAAEAELLESVSRDLQSAAAVLSYNGKAFDEAVLRVRLAYYGCAPLPARPHIDLLHHVRRRFGARLPDCRLPTVEQRLLGRPRDDDLPSSLVPEFYAAFLESEDPRWIAPVLDHNRRDIASLPALLSVLSASDHDR